ncbi:sensor histidine kinase [Clostridiales bacterium]|nr:sensor histidine kinase [Clostridiales bacterium]
MKIFTNKEIRNLFLALSLIWAFAFLLTEGFLWFSYHQLSLYLLFLFLLTGCAIGGFGLAYFKRQNQIMEQAVLRINAFLDGDCNARIECDSEGELYRLFYTVNSLATVLNAHAENELKEKDFLKNTISDISHQLKTPLAALNIYNGLLQDEDVEASSVKEFAHLSEQELDRIGTLVQNLLKITKLDAGTIVLEKKIENVADMMRDIELHFAYRAKHEQKEIILSGTDNVFILCDRDWLSEAIGNIVKNALDHTKHGDTIQISWRVLPSTVQIVVKDNGYGIHPEDLHHIFKRFYRSRFSQDTQGIGLGLPLAKAITEAHEGVIEVDSELGIGTSFTMNFFDSYKIVG